MRPERSVVVVLVFLLVVLPSGPAFAQDPGLTSGKRQVEEGDFETAITMLEPVVARLTPVGGRDAAEASLYLGIAHLALDQGGPARLCFRRALDFDPKLRLSSDRFSPKVIGAFGDARREREAAARAATAPQAGTPTGGKKGGASRTLLLAGAGVAAGVGIALAAGGGSSSPSPGELRFTGARFAPQALECPDGAVSQPLLVGIDLEATNGQDAPMPLTAVSTALIIVASSIPGEVGFTSPDLGSSVTPSTVPRGTTTLHVQTSLTCNNGSGDAPRFNEWSGRITLVTAAGAVALETTDRLRVNIP